MCCYGDQVWKRASARGDGRWALRQSTAYGAGNTMAAAKDDGVCGAEKGTHLYVDAGTAVHVPQMNFLMAVSVAKQQQQQHLFQKGHGTMHGLYSVGVGATEARCTGWKE